MGKQCYKKFNVFLLPQVWNLKIEGTYANLFRVKILAGSEQTSLKYGFPPKQGNKNSKENGVNE